MIVLSQTTDKIQVVLGSAVSTNQLQCFASWRDITSAPTYTAGRSAVNTNNTTDVDLVAAPASSTQRLIDFLSVYNADTSPESVTVKLDASGTEYIIAKATLAIGESLQYENSAGFSVRTSTGELKSKQTFGSVVASDLNTTVIASNVTNDNVTANTIQDVTGLSFPCISGEMYWFRFDILYTAAATTTGSRWSINGPASPTRLVYTSEYSLAATTTTRNANNISYDLPAAANASSGATGSNKAVIEGVIQTSSNGDCIARFASEVSASAIVALAGSMVTWRRVV